ncbi:hypothetical protein N431DRAFT_43307 [Stipitochalara longipes BDJ]|nr:hypothetical protein N431DRAFT_43307 [Stipitochalara longipes BDJ]
MLWMNDEGDGVRDVLIGELVELIPLPKSHIMVTSRWLDSIGRAFAGCLRLEIRAEDQDVAQYIENRIESSSRLQRRIKEDFRLKSDIIETVLEQCQGMFLLARLHMHNLATKPHVRAIREALKAIPRKLEDTYDLVMQRISEQNEDDADLARRVLPWPTHPARPPTAAEPQHALAIEPGQSFLDSYSLIDEEVMLSVYAGIVTIEEETRLIRFIHYTTQEYLERIRDTRFPLGRLEITEACMEYSQREGLANRFLSDYELIKRIRSKPFYEYAAMNWGAHADEDVQRIAETKILKFLEKHQTITAMALKVQYRRSPGNLILPYQSGPHVAASFGLSHILECQIKAGFNSEVFDSLGQTPLHIAVSKNQRDCVRILLVNDQEHGNQFHRAWTLLRIAAIRGLLDFARLVIESRADFWS